MWSQSLFPCTLVCKSEYRFCYSESLGAGYSQLQDAVSFVQIQLSTGHLHCTLVAIYSSLAYAPLEQQTHTKSERGLT